MIPMPAPARFARQAGPRPVPALTGAGAPHESVGIGAAFLAARPPISRCPVASVGGAARLRTAAHGGAVMTRVVLASMVLSVTASLALAQQGTSELRGRAVDQQGGALPGVAVVVTNQDNGTFRETVTGADGAFLLSGMTPGTYEIRGELTGFKRYQARDVRLEVGRSALVELRLEIGAVAESVTVTGESPLVDTSSKAIGGNVTAQEFVDLPSFNRNFSSYLALRPRRRVDGVGDDVRRRFDQRRRPERPQRELHDGRVEQQRRLQRRQRRRPGADAGRGGAGVPAADQPVRRRVRHGLGRRGQLGVQAGHQPVPRQRVHVLPG